MVVMEAEMKLLSLPHIVSWESHVIGWQTWCGARRLRKNPWTKSVRRMYPGLAPHGAVNNTLVRSYYCKSIIMRASQTRVRARSVVLSRLFYLYLKDVPMWPYIHDQLRVID
jgi:hypothetical protein